MTKDTNYFSAIDAHIATITPAHRAAFQAAGQARYAAGAVVWVYDHYNTARVLLPSIEGSWVVELTDADGATWRTVYEGVDLRPAAAPVEFRWPADKTSAHPLLVEYAALVASSVPPTCSQWLELVGRLRDAATIALVPSDAYAPLELAADDCAARAAARQDNAPR